MNFQQQHDMVCIRDILHRLRDGGEIRLGRGVTGWPDCYLVEADGLMWSLIPPEYISAMLDEGFVRKARRIPKWPTGSIQPIPMGILSNKGRKAVFDIPIVEAQRPHIVTLEKRT